MTMLGLMIGFTEKEILEGSVAKGKALSSFIVRLVALNSHVNSKDMPKSASQVMALVVGVLTSGGKVKYKTMSCW